MEQLERYLTDLNLRKMSPKLEQTLRENVQCLRIPKHEILRPVGTLTEYLYFIEKGLFHYFVDTDEDQSTILFKSENEIIVSLKKFGLEGKQLRAIGVEALEDSILWPIPGSLIPHLIESHPEFASKLIETITNDIAREKEALINAAGEGGLDTYHHFRLFSPNLLYRVPLPYLSSYTKIPEMILFHLLSGREKPYYPTTTRREKR